MTVLNDELYLFYSSSYLNDKLTLFKYNNNNWVNTFSDGFSFGKSAYNKAETFNEDIYVISKDYDLQSKALVYKIENNTVSLISFDSSSNGEVMFPTIKRSNNELFIGYKDAKQNGRLTIKELKNGKWETYGKEGLTGDTTDKITFFDFQSKLNIIYLNKDSILKWCKKINNS